MTISICIGGKKFLLVNQTADLFFLIRTDSAIGCKFDGVYLLVLQEWNKEGGSRYSRRLLWAMNLWTVEIRIRKVRKQFFKQDLF